MKLLNGFCNSKQSGDEDGPYPITGEPKKKYHLKYHCYDQIL